MLELNCDKRYRNGSDITDCIYHHPTPSSHFDTTILCVFVSQITDNCLFNSLLNHDSSNTDRDKWIYAESAPIPIYHLWCITMNVSCHNEHSSVIKWCISISMHSLYRTWRNCNVSITSKRCRFGVTIILLLRHVSAGLLKTAKHTN